MEGLKEALSYVADLQTEANKTEVVNINGRTYANKSLKRYDKPEKAEKFTVKTLSAVVDYVRDCNREFRSGMILHVASPTRVVLMSRLDEEREREVLLEADAEVSKFEFDRWYDQEGFMINLQANFESNEDLEIVKKVAGNTVKRNENAVSDDGVTQIATATVGVATKADVIVPNPVTLIPYRTFQEVQQPDSKFIFRIGDKEVPAFKLVEAQGGIWKNTAINNIKAYFTERLLDMPEDVSGKIVVIG